MSTNRIRSNEYAVYCIVNDLVVVVVKALEVQYRIDIRRTIIVEYRIDFPSYGIASATTIKKYRELYPTYSIPANTVASQDNVTEVAGEKQVCGVNNPINKRGTTVRPGIQRIA